VVGKIIENGFEGLDTAVSYGSTNRCVLSAAGRLKSSPGSAPTPVRALPMNDAVDDELIPIHPVLNLGHRTMKKVQDAIEARRVSMGEETEGKPDPSTGRELKRLLDTVKQHYSERYSLCMLLARTGIRIGEALGLKWGDIDFNSQFINLNRSLSRGNITTLKSKRERQVDMSLQLAEALEAYRLQCKKKGFELGLGGEPDFVFTDTKGGHIDINNWLRRVFDQALEKAELRKKSASTTFGTPMPRSALPKTIISTTFQNSSATFQPSLHRTFMPAGCRARKRPKWTPWTTSNTAGWTRLTRGKGQKIFAIKRTPGAPKSGF